MHGPEALAAGNGADRFAAHGVERLVPAIFLDRPGAERLPQVGLRLVRDRHASPGRRLDHSIGQWPFRGVIDDARGQENRQADERPEQQSTPARSVSELFRGHSQCLHDRLDSK
jgi:hypothetical protein